MGRLFSRMIRLGSSLGLLSLTGIVHADLSDTNWVAITDGPSPTLEDLNIPADASTRGMWSGVFRWPMNGLHAALLPNGRVFTFGTSPDGDLQNGRWYDVWDPALGTRSSAHNTVYDPERQDSFCASATYLSNGTMLISGGNGETTSTLYEPASHTSYTDPSAMAEVRWYPTMINLPDGRPIMMGGMVPYTEDMVNDPEQAMANGLASMTPEVYEHGQWRSLFGAYSRDAFGPDYLRTSYPRAWVAPNGQVFGISADKMWYLDADANGGNGAITYSADFKRGYSKDNPVNVGAVGSSAMFAPGRILQIGGNGGHNADELPASNMATVIDINGDTPELLEQPAMAFARRYPNTTVLATGEVLVTGGTTFGNHYAGEPGDAVYAAEIWNPQTGTWSIGASARRTRVYHSITTLLADGTVLSTGGGTPGPVTNLNGEIYYPPYLFETVEGVTRLAQRPQMSAISGLAYEPQSELQVDMASEAGVAQLVLLGLSSGTHSFNTGQRRIPLTFSQDHFRLSATLPNANLAPPGYYQVVAINEQGTPSKGVIIGIGPGQASPPVVVTPYDPPLLDEPIETPAITAGETAHYRFTPEQGVTYSWSFSDTGETTPYASDATISHTFTEPGLFVVTINARSATGALSTRRFMQAVSTGKTLGAPASSTQLAIQPDQPNRVWTVNPDNHSVSVVDSVDQSLLAEIPVGIKPQSIAIGRNGRVWVSNKGSDSLSIMDAESFEVLDTVALPRGSQPHGLVIAPNGREIYVVLEAAGKLIKLDASSGAQLGSVDLGIHVRHLAISADGDTLLVSRFITPPLPGEGTATPDLNAGGGEVLVVDAPTLTLIDTILLQHSNKADTEIQGGGLPNYLGAPVIAPDGSNAWIPSKQDNIRRGALRSQPLDFQNTVRAISSRVDLTTFREQFEHRADHDNAGLGSAAAYHPNGVYLFVALETSREVVALNAFSGTELFRLKVGLAPQGLAVSEDGLRLYVKEFMQRRISVVDLSDLIQRGQLQAKIIATLPTVRQEQLPAAVLAGKQLFYDARDTRLARDGYLSCATCHNDSGQDGRVWDFTGFGSGLRNTIALNGRAAMGHGFLHWNANLDELQDFEQQIRTLAAGTGLMADTDYNAGSRSQPLGDKKAGISEDLDNLAAYVASLSRFAPSPYRNDDGSLTPQADAGRDLFMENCQRCHGGRHFTIAGDGDSLKDVGTAATGIDVPTLRDAWATAPYLHSGSAPTLQAAIAAHRSEHISTEFTEPELDELVAYVQQIGGDEPRAGFAPRGYWSFEEGEGDISADLSGHNHPLTLKKTDWVPSPQGQAAHFSSLWTQASPGKALLDTAGSFTASAWVKLDHLYGIQTLINQDGQEISGFWLQYSDYERRFMLTMHDQDSRRSRAYRAVSQSKVRANQWYHVVGVRDQHNGLMKIYVDGQLEGIEEYQGGWAAMGDLNVGRGKWGSLRHKLKGTIDEVSVFDYALNDDEVAQLFAEQYPFTAVDGPLQDLTDSAQLDSTYVSRWHSLDAINDGYVPTSSTDESEGAYSNYRWFGGSGSTNWVTFHWDAPKTLVSLDLYWLTNYWTILSPSEAYVEYWDGHGWISLGDIGTDLNTFNRLEFLVTTTALRVSMRSARFTGIIEARVMGY